MPHTILESDIANNKMKRLAYEIAERNMGEEEIILAGIKGNGSLLAHILKDLLKDLFSGNVVITEIDINKKDPQNCTVSDKINFNDKTVIIVDDVSNSGRTLIYALKPFLSFYPKKIQTLVLVKRSYREFPASADYVGLSVATAHSEKIIVNLSGNKIQNAVIE